MKEAVTEQQYKKKFTYRILITSTLMAAAILAVIFFYFAR